MLSDKVGSEMRCQGCTVLACSGGSVREKDRQAKWCTINHRFAAIKQRNSQRQLCIVGQRVAPGVVAECKCRPDYGDGAAMTCSAVQGGDGQWRTTGINVPGTV